MLGTDLSSHPLVAKAQSRWLNAAEIMSLLSADSPLPMQTRAPDMTKRCVSDGGCLFLYDRKTCRKFRDDDVAWVTRADGRTLLEAHERLRVPDQPSIILDVYYATSKCGTLHRRVYWHTTAPADATPQPSSGGSRLYRVRGAVRDTRVLVHYLSAADAAASAVEHSSRVKVGNLAVAAPRNPVPRQSSQSSVVTKSSRSVSTKRTTEAGRKRSASDTASEEGEEEAVLVAPGAKRANTIVPAPMPNIPRTLADLNPHIETLRNVLKRLESFRSMCSDASTSVSANNKNAVCATSPSLASAGANNGGGTAKAAVAATAAAGLSRQASQAAPSPSAYLASSPTSAAPTGSAEVDSRHLYTYGAQHRLQHPPSPTSLPHREAPAAHAQLQRHQAPAAMAAVHRTREMTPGLDMEHSPEEVDDLMAMLLNEEEQGHDNSDHLANLYQANYPVAMHAHGHHMPPPPAPARVSGTAQVPAPLSRQHSAHQHSLMHEEPRDLQEFLAKQEIASVVAEVQPEVEPLPLADDLEAMGLAPIRMWQAQPSAPSPPAAAPASSGCGNMPLPAHLQPNVQPKWASLLHMAQWGRGHGSLSGELVHHHQPLQTAVHAPMPLPPTPATTVAAAAPSPAEEVEEKPLGVPRVPSFTLIDDMNDVDCLVCPMMGPVAWVSDVYDEPPSLSELLALNGHSSAGLGYLRDL